MLGSNRNRVVVLFILIPLFLFYHQFMMVANIGAIDDLPCKPCPISVESSLHNYDTALSKPTIAAAPVVALPLSSPSFSSASSMEPVNVVYALSHSSGDEILELEQSLKSLIYNSPFFSELAIYFICDEPSMVLINELLDQIEIFKTPHQMRHRDISFHFLNIQSKIVGWEKELKRAVSVPLADRHTFGTFLRLFLHETPLGK
jgi:hypothetical protein